MPLRRGGQDVFSPNGFYLWHLPSIKQSSNFSVRSFRADSSPFKANVFELPLLHGIKSSKIGDFVGCAWQPVPVGGDNDPKCFFGPDRPRSSMLVVLVGCSSLIVHASQKCADLFLRKRCPTLLLNRADLYRPGLIRGSESP